MPIISTDIDVAGKTGYEITGDYTHVTIRAGITVQADDLDTAFAMGTGIYNSLTNLGTVSGLYGVNATGIRAFLYNAESGIIVGNVAIRSTENGFQLFNNGSVAGLQYGISVLGGSAVIVNNGHIAGGDYSVRSVAAPVTMTNHGLLDGDATLGGASTFHNLGTVVGDITFGSGQNVFDGIGGTVQGSISGGTASDLFDLSRQTVTGTIDGGAGTDTIIFNSASGAMTVDLAQGTALGAGMTDHFQNIENVVGSGYGDTITGDGNANVLAAAGGNDIVHGGAGDDTIDGGAGDDQLFGDIGSSDTVSYSSAVSGVNVNLGTTAQQATGGAGNDMLSGFENLTGSAFNDSLVGDGGANLIRGGLGNDMIAAGGGADIVYGEGGNDVINGGDSNNMLYGGGDDDTITGGDTGDIIEGDTGRDTLTGGGGADIFLYKTYSDTSASSPDLITDFQKGIDKIDLRALHITATDSFAISSSGGFTFVSVDYLGDGSVNALIKVNGTGSVVSGDILWATNAFPAAIHHAVMGNTAMAPLHDALVATLHVAAMDHALIR